MPLLDLVLQAAHLNLPGRLLIGEGRLKGLDLCAQRRLLGHALLQVGDDRDRDQDQDQYGQYGWMGGQGAV